MRTSTRAGPMLKINCPIFQHCSAPCMAHNIPFFPIHPHMQKFTDNDDINMPDSSYVGHNCSTAMRSCFNCLRDGTVLYALQSSKARTKNKNEIRSKI
jgi:hypothetical protein